MNWSGQRVEHMRSGVCWRKIWKRPDIAFSGIPQAPRFQWYLPHIYWSRPSRYAAQYFPTHPPPLRSFLCLLLLLLVTISTIFHSLPITSSISAKHSLCPNLFSAFHLQLFLFCIANDQNLLVLLSLLLKSKNVNNFLLAGPWSSGAPLLPNVSPHSSSLSWSAQFTR